MGAPSTREIPRGKRVITKNQMTIANGQMRLMGGSRDDASSQAGGVQKTLPTGKRTINMPQQNNMRILQ